MPNGVVSSYSYDADSHLTGITYTNGGSVLGDLAYTYDSAGRVATVGGSLAHTNLPPEVTSASYNADNQLTQWGGTAMTYDPNGNLTNDGAHTYTWSPRNLLASIDGGNTASFVYGPFGRRILKTVYGTSTGYLYDGANVVQELSGGNPSANLLTGGLDDIFTRTDSTGAYSFLRDGLGSTLALTDSTGAVQQSYSYGPYGYTSTSGNTTSNSYQYIGREMDATGLYYFRARYYNPNTGRFLSEDPIGFAGSGPNLYAYVGDSPTNFIDPFGMDKKNPGAPPPCDDPSGLSCTPNSPGPNGPQPPQPPQHFWQKPGCGDALATLGVGLAGTALTLGAVATAIYLGPEAFEGIEGIVDIAHIAPIGMPGLILTVYGGVGVAQNCF